MASKRAYYEVNFNFEKLTLSEQERIYNKLMSVLDQDLKDKLHITVTDLLGGKHHVYDDMGVRPDGITCKRCVNVDCAYCSVWKKVAELESNKEEMEK